MRSNASNLIVRMAALGMISGILLSPSLWGFTNRNGFPFLPVLGESTPDHAVLWQGILAVSTIAAVLLKPGNKWISALSMSIILLLCALDLNRLQPWVWCYLLVFSLSIVGDLIVALPYLLAGIYAWSGFNKITPYFAEDNFPWFCETFTGTKALGHFTTLGYALAILEMLFGIGFVFRKTRFLSGLGLMGMHLVIIIFLAKMGWNLVVIPWNIALVGMIWLVIKPGTKTSPELARISLRKAWISIVFGWLCPLLYFSGFWPYALSWQLYGNTQPEATFFSAGKQVPQIGGIEQYWNKYAFDGGTKLLLDDWATGVLRVPMFASEHTFRQMGEYLCRQSTGSADSSGLYILTVNQWDKSRERLIRIKCEELTKAN